jgi:deoxyribodipyrimidine photo-lyase
VHRVLNQANWRPENIAPKPSGSREGWWGSEPWAEALLDQIITWRELGYVFCFERIDDFDTYESLPEWAKKTLNEHAEDKRTTIYSLDELEKSKTHDPIWNAAQNQLRREGRIHNYLRMLWGKKILEWSKTPQEALEKMIELNNRWAIDGRNPNSYSGIFWTLGRFDRAWGERPIFGKIRFMSSQSTSRKIKLKNYLKQYGASK